MPGRTSKAEPRYPPYERERKKERERERERETERQTERERQREREREFALQGRTAGRNLAGVRSSTYTTVPYFWSAFFGGKVRARPVLVRAKY